MTTICGKEYPPNYFKDPTEEFIRASGFLNEMEAIRKEIRQQNFEGMSWEEAKLIFDRLDRAAYAWAKKTYADRHYCCRAGYGKFFPGLYNRLGTLSGGLAGDWVSLKNSQEAERFWGGDIGAKVGGEYGRAIGVKNTRCAICLRKVKCFWFDDNESCGHETLCAECLKAGIKILEAN